MCNFPTRLGTLHANCVIQGMPASPRTMSATKIKMASAVNTNKTISRMVSSIACLEERGTESIPLTSTNYPDLR